MVDKSSLIDRLRDETVTDLVTVLEESLSSKDSEISLPLVRPSFGSEEVLESIDSLLSTFLTMGKKVKRFETSFAKYQGVKHAIMVNSGSSANFLAMHIIANPALKHHIKPGDEVIVPATTWSTSIFPIIDVGAVPVLVDSNSDTFNLDLSCLNAAITPKTRAIMAVHLLGNPCMLDALREIADHNNLFLIEDCCEAHGAEYKGKKVGAGGDIGTFSFFFSHHISTIEGGMIITDNDDYAELARCMRAHGWIRDLENQDEIAKKYPEIDHRFLFYNRGFNLRPTEIQGAFGIHQLEKLDSFIDARRKNAEYWVNGLAPLEDHLSVQIEQDGGKHAWFGFPILIKGEPKKRDQLVSVLEKNRIATRPILAGNMANHPAMKMFSHRVSGKLTVSDNLHRHGVFIGNHHAVTQEEKDHFVGVLKSFFD
jgi:CDP-6-deoxy-D-xylo-4-hexulose-3-dehydrase